MYGVIDIPQRKETHRGQICVRTNASMILDRKTIEDALTVQDVHPYLLHIDGSKGCGSMLFLFVEGAECTLVIVVYTFFFIPTTGTSNAVM